MGNRTYYTPLDDGQKVEEKYLPSYVDDVLEFENLAAFPETGETGKIYVALDTNKTYRWSGSTYVMVGSPDIPFDLSDRMTKGVDANGAVVDGAVVEGLINRAKDDNTQTPVTINVASGMHSHAEGGYVEYNDIDLEWVYYPTTASGESSHAEGSMTTASGTHSHAEGYYSTASGNQSHAEGQSTASNISAHAEGSRTTASGFASHAEGSGTTASASCAHAEGSSTTASGERSHAEGSNSIASGNQSHAEGNRATASGQASHAEGNGTIASRRSQHVVGEYNVEDTTGADGSARGDYAVVVGNGTASTRSNAFAIKWDGTFVFANGTEITPAQFASIKALLNS